MLRAGIREPVGDRVGFLGEGRRLNLSVPPQAWEGN